MKVMPVLLLLALSLNSLAHSSKDRHHPKPSKKIDFEVVPLNSPVKDSVAKFRLVLPKNADISKVYYVIKNSSKIFDLFKNLSNGYEAQTTENNEIDIPVSKYAPGQYRIHVWAISKKGEKHVFWRKHHDFAKFVIDESLQVAMPDPKKNNATLAGIDSDRDGIRDDIQRWINEKYANKPSTKQALKQYARISQMSLLYSNDKLASIENSKKVAESLECLSWVVDVDKSIEISRSAQSLLLNTEERVRSSLQRDKNLHGQGRPDSITSLSIDERNQLCNFEAVKE